MLESSQLIFLSTCSSMRLVLQSHKQAHRKICLSFRRVYEPLTHKIYIYFNIRPLKKGTTITRCVSDRVIVPDPKRRDSYSSPGVAISSLTSVNRDVFGRTVDPYPDRDTILMLDHIRQAWLPTLVTMFNGQGILIIIFGVLRDIGISLILSLWYISLREYFRYCGLYIENEAFVSFIESSNCHLLLSPQL